MKLKQSDKLIFLTNIVIALSLLPSIFSYDKPHITTSLFNVIVSIVFMYNYNNLKLRWSAIGNGLIGMMWMILLIQKL